MKSKSLFLVITSIALFSAANLHGKTLTLQPQADTWIYQAQPDANFERNQLFVGTNRADNQTHHATLLRFDLSDVKGKVTSAVLNLYTAPDAQIGAGNGMTIEAHGLLTADWNSKTVTFNDRTKGEPWKTPGGDFDPEPVVAVKHTPTTEIGMALAFDITSLVQKWVDKSVPSLGVLLCLAGYPQQAYKGEIQAFESTENFAKIGAQYAPTLVITTED
ncbi:MAG: DNRLRE domain-containing protein [Verrucomicrobia bacterium]|nr:DNRLRE domain-containing protein [Verrucomicrobiota bacterium]